MSDTITRAEPTEQQTTEHFDIIIVGAGISGVGVRTTCRSSTRRRPSWCWKGWRASAARG